MQLNFSYFLFIILFVFSFKCIAQNPITPPGVFLADPSAKTMPDGKLYIYGSLDEDCNYYCSYEYPVMVTSDLKNWEVFNQRFATKGINDRVSYNDDLLYAPDCIYANDSFYLYYCQPNSDAEGVAVSATATGPFTNSQKLDLGGFPQIDPSVFIDDDGQAYYIWGQFSLKMSKLKPNMRELDKESIQDRILTENQHFFHEGAYMTKRNGIYYLVYADISRGNIPVSLGYSTSNTPFGPYEYRGVIIDNLFCNPGNWNNHGSIVEFKNQWYVFYHRSTQGCKSMRKACMEPITFLPDGSIAQVEMTSQGTNGPLDAFQKIESEWACLFHGNVQIKNIEQVEVLTKFTKENKIAYKYIDFKDGVSKITVRIRAGQTTGGFNVKLDQPWGTQLGYVHFDKKGSGETWKEVTFNLKEILGVHAIWFDFYTLEEALELDVAIDWFQFQ